MVAALVDGLPLDLPPGDVVRAWKPRLLGVREVLQARFGARLQAINRGVEATVPIVPGLVREIVVP